MSTYSIEAQRAIAKGIADGSVIEVNSLSEYVGCAPGIEEAALEALTETNVSAGENYTTKIVKGLKLLGQISIALNNILNVGVLDSAMLSVIGEVFKGAGAFFKSMVLETIGIGLELVGGLLFGLNVFCPMLLKMLQVLKQKITNVVQRTSIAW